MKRIHLFEFEDLSWFPDWLRTCLTNLIIVMHKLLSSDRELAELIAEILKKTKSTQIVDLCSGSGGPMIDVMKNLEQTHKLDNIKLSLSDLYPNLKSAKTINERYANITYMVEPFDATNSTNQITGLRTMVGSFHHMNPNQAKKILESASKSEQPICIFEISDNSMPLFLWWIAIPTNFIMCLFVTPLVRPMTWQQLIFTYLIPIIPLFFAWDGAVSNARTYTLNDIDMLLEGIDTKNYEWEKGIIKGKSKKIYLIGSPK